MSGTALELRSALIRAIPWVAASGRGSAQEALAYACAVADQNPWEWTNHRAVLRSRLALLAGGVSVSTLGDDELWEAAKAALLDQGVAA